MMIVGALICARSSAHGQTVQVPPAINWLTSDPLTMLDWGLFKAQKSLDQALARLNDEEKDAVKWEATPLFEGKDYVEENKKLGVDVPPTGYKARWAWAGYDTERSTIELGFEIQPAVPTSMKDNRTAAQMLTAEACTKLLDIARSYVMASAGRFVSLDPTVYREGAEYAVRVWFEHNSIGRANMPPNLYRDLANLTEITIRLEKYSSNDPPTVKCVAPFTGGPVTTVLNRTPQ
jgi:hypothetical protein